MQHWVGRAIGIVFDILGLRSRELLPRMKAGDLQFAFQVQLGHRSLADIEEIVVLEEVRQYPGMYQESRLAMQRIRCVQVDQLGTKLCQQPRSGSFLADPKAHAIAAVDAFCKRAQIEANDRPFQPTTRRGNDFIGSNDQSSAAVPSLNALNSSILIAPLTGCNLRTCRCLSQFQPPSSPEMESVPKLSTPRSRSCPRSARHSSGSGTWRASRGSGPRAIHCRATPLPASGEHAWR